MAHFKLGQGAWVHFVAIGGTGMGALAGLLKDHGCEVTGSDGPLYPPMSVYLESKKIPLKAAYAVDNLRGSSWGIKKENPDLVVVGNAISRGHVEAAEVEKLVEAGKTERMSFAQALAEFAIRDRRSFVVAGTHGKTTTTTLMAWALESLGTKPGFFIGGIPVNFPQGCHMGEGPVFASEGDEYDTAYWDKESKFLHYRPSWVLCTGIEFDHADIFANVEAIEKSFLKLGTKTSEGWLIIDRESAPRMESVEKVAKQLRADHPSLKILRYGRAADSDYRLLAIQNEALPDLPDLMGTRLELQLRDQSKWSLLSFMSGEHNALNAVGVIGTLHAAGLLTKEADAQKFLLSFRGVKRRQEEVYRDSKLVVIDDFAHHPTAIRETLKAIRGRYPKADVAAFFEARSATSARKFFTHDYEVSFDEADAIFLVPPTKSNIPIDQKLDIHEVESGLLRRGKKVWVESDVNALAQHFSTWLKQRQSSKPVVAMVMSNGAFGGLHGILSRNAQS